MSSKEDRELIRAGVEEFKRTPIDNLAHILEVPYEIAEAIQIAFDEYLIDNPDAIERMTADFFRRVNKTEEEKK